MVQTQTLKLTSIFLAILGTLLILAGLYSGYDNVLRPWITGVPHENPGATLAAVKRRGHLRCGIEGSLHGFSEVHGRPSFNYRGRKFFSEASGFDTDFCRAVAVAIFGNFEGRLYFTPAGVDERFTLVRNGSIDVLLRNTTWTAMRDTQRRVNFGPVIFHDGQKFLVPVDSGIEELADLNGRSICVLPETTTYRNVVALFEDMNMDYELVVERRPGESFRDNEDVIEAYLRRKCEVLTSDESQLTSRRAELDDPKSHRVIPSEAISYEPLAPVIAEGDSQWQGIVNYAIWATIYAEQLGITSKNVSSVDAEANQVTRAFYGLSDENGSGPIALPLGLEADFARNIVAQVGNYGEIFERNLGNLIEDRGPNQVWELDREGRLFAPPFSP